MSKESERFWAKVIKYPNGCWEWQGATCGGRGNYGQFHNKGKHIMAHRFAYNELRGSIPKGYEIDHLCRNKCCVNPDHMEVVTRSENTKRGLIPHILRQRHLSKTHCPQGHPYDEANTYITPLGHRDCRICRKEANKRYIRRFSFEQGTG